MLLDRKYIRTNQDLVALFNAQVVPYDVVFVGTALKRISGLKIIGGDLGLSDASIESLGDVTEIQGNLWTSFSHVNGLSSLGELKKVQGDVSLKYSKIVTLEKLEYVGGSLNLRDTSIKSLGNLKHVGGDLFLPKAVQKDLDVSGIKIEGKVRYWSDNPKDNFTLTNTVTAEVVPWEHFYIYSYADLKRASKDQVKFYRDFKSSFLEGVCLDLQGYTNYAFILLFDLFGNMSLKEPMEKVQKLAEQFSSSYPKASNYLGSLLMDFAKKKADLELLKWVLSSFDQWLTSEDEIKFLLESFSEEEVFQLADLNSPTAFAIYSFYTQQYENDGLYEEAWEYRKKCENYEVRTLRKYSRYLKGFIDGEVLLNITGNSSLTKYGEKNREAIEESIHDYLRASIEKGKTYDNIFGDGDWLNSFSEIIRHAENDVRQVNGIPKVGEGWISETELYYFLNGNLPKVKVVQHASPAWLGRQHLDVYLPEYNIAIEYQGAQHSRAIDFFGGEEALEKSKERDNRKRKLCRENECTLLYCFPEDDHSKILNEILALVNSSKE